MNLRAASSLVPGDHVAAAAFGTHTVETTTTLPGGAIRVDFDDAIVLIAAPAYLVPVLEDAAA